MKRSLGKMTQQEQARIRAIEWYKKNKTSALARIKVRSNNPQAKAHKREYDKKHRVLNQEKIKAFVALWYLQNKISVKARGRVWRQKNPERAQYQRYLDRAKVKGCEFGLTYELFLEAIKMPCVYCGFNDGVVGLDRIDSAKGYLVENIVPCCKVCNYMKLDHTLEEWLTAMEDIFNNLGYAITSSTKENS